MAEFDANWCQILLAIPTDRELGTADLQLAATGSMYARPARGLDLGRKALRCETRCTAGTVVTPVVTFEGGCHALWM